MFCRNSRTYRRRGFAWHPLTLVEKGCQHFSKNKLRNCVLKHCNYKWNLPREGSTIQILHYYLHVYQSYANCTAHRYANWYIILEKYAKSAPLVIHDTRFSQFPVLIVCTAKKEEEEAEKRRRGRGMDNWIIVIKRGRCLEFHFRAFEPGDVYDWPCICPQMLGRCTRAGAMHTHCNCNPSLRGEFTLSSQDFIHIFETRRDGDRKLRPVPTGSNEGSH